MAARRLRRKNVEALRLAIELSEREANKEVMTKVNVARHAEEQASLPRGLSGMRYNSNSSDMTISSTSSSDDDAPPHAAAYTEEGHSRIDDRKG
ncbi:hypothetical protein D1007_03135 [Hordeum vulgare]|nr:hypothetical protein D1007_03135 [Hordeum vulgare]